ncbi:MAG: nucleotidyl transferase AbiEii/AbiGii toxin family protein [Anaerolineales bacterium]|nr:nucleotidyl transferase AbiEii/AbiGii toxin family protein [Anaerolineales bacterium]
MKKEPVKNIPASILTRLRHQANELNRPFAETLQYYVMERFLYRLSQTKYADKIILKGGLLFYVWNLPMRRSTRDIDFRGYVSSNRSTLSKIIHEVIEVSAPEDGLVFDPQSILVDETQIDSDYQGVRIKLIALLERTRIPVQIDIGFSDELMSKPETIAYPNILPNQKTVRMKGYPKETVIAEKFHAMIRHGDLNSRMKDYYDLWLISEPLNLMAHLCKKPSKRRLGKGKRIFQPKDLRPYLLPLPAPTKRAGATSCTNSNWITRKSKTFKAFSKRFGNFSNNLCNRHSTEPSQPANGNRAMVGNNSFHPSAA